MFANRRIWRHEKRSETVISIEKFALQVEKVFPFSVPIKFVFFYHTLE